MFGESPICLISALGSKTRKQAEGKKLEPTVSNTKNPENTNLCQRSVSSISLSASESHDELDGQCIFSTRYFSSRVHRNLSVDFRAVLCTMKYHCCYHGQFQMLDSFSHL